MPDPGRRRFLATIAVFPSAVRLKAAATATTDGGFPFHAGGRIRLGYAAGRGRVDVKACVAALRDIGFHGWAVGELDRVVDAGGSPKASPMANRDCLVKQLGLPL